MYRKIYTVASKIELTLVIEGSSMDHNPKIRLWARFLHSKNSKSKEEGKNDHPEVHGRVYKYKNLMESIIFSKKWKKVS